METPITSKEAFFGMVPQSICASIEKELYAERELHEKLVRKYDDLTRIQPEVAMIREELAKAKRKHQSYPRDLFEQVSIITEECGEVAKACLEYLREPSKKVTPEHIRVELAQLGAMAIRMLENLNDTLDNMPNPIRGCAACDRGDFSLGHAEWCSKQQDLMTIDMSIPRREWVGGINPSPFRAIRNRTKQSDILAPHLPIKSKTHKPSHGGYPKEC